MSTISLPYNIQPGDDEDADQVMANFSAITSVANGALTASDNVSVATAVAIPGSSSTAGDSSELARANHTHAVRGVETATTDPSSSNFAGRCYYNTIDNRLRLCTDAAGSGTWVTISPLIAADLVVHGSNHASTGSDPLPARAISAANMGRAVAATAVPAAATAFGNSTRGDLITGISITCSGTQIVTVTGQITAQNIDGGSRIAMLALYEGTTEVANLGESTIPGGGSQLSALPVSQTFSLTDGAHTLVLKGAAGGAANYVYALRTMDATTPALGTGNRVASADGASHIVSTLTFVIG